MWAPRKPTWHLVEEPLSSTIVSLQELAVHRPVNVGDETGGFVALPNFFVSLGDSIDVHGPIVGAHSQVGAVRGKLHLVDHLLAVLDVNHLRHVPAGARGEKDNWEPRNLQSTGNKTDTLNNLYNKN